MPIYEYTCADCGRDFEELVFGQDETPPCPHCHSANTQKQMSCCSFKHGGPGAAPAKGPAASGNTGGSACAGCSGKSCSTCH